MALAQWLASNGWNISKAVGMSVLSLIYRKTVATILCAHLLLSPSSGWGCQGPCPLQLYVTFMGQRTEGSHWPAAIKTTLILHISDLEKLLQPASLQMKTLSQVLSHLQMCERLKDSGQSSYHRPPPTEPLRLAGVAKWLVTPWIRFLKEKEQTT